jgi:transcriptional regulator with XRE-family HTH domain
MKTASEEADMVRFGARVAELRRAKNVTQEILAAKIGLSVVTLGHVEQGRRSPSFVTMRKLAKALGVPMGELFKGL